MKIHHYHYRFASSLWPRERQLGGGWWFTFETLNTIKNYAASNQLEFTYAARLFLALPEEWNRLDSIVRAQLVEHMDAYIGEGRVAKTEKDKWTPIQHMKVSQIYIPGLISNSNTKNLYETIWSGVSFQYAHNQKPV